ncbi:MAG TPA: hypothetical protein VGN36_06655, partial [Sphingorhabdus sp.]|nr:hypothetical protein [Sphingorhabdus sp.]
MMCNQPVRLGMSVSMLLSLLTILLGTGLLHAGPGNVFKPPEYTPAQRREIDDAKNPVVRDHLSYVVVYRLNGDCYARTLALQELDVLLDPV